DRDRRPRRARRPLHRGARGGRRPADADRAAPAAREKLVSGAPGRRLIYSLAVSLDGYVAGPAGEIDWAAPDEQLHRFHNEQMRAIDVQLCGRRLYETMLYWETPSDDEAP